MGSIIFDKLPRCSFAGIEFPIVEIGTTGELRDHEHEYPHAPGGDPEKLGRKLYVFRVKALFHATFRRYPGLYPGIWNRLRNKFEAGTTADLVVPTLGTLKAYAKRWDELATSRKRSGVDVDLTFREDLQDAFTANSLLVTTDGALPQAQSRLALAKAIYAATPPGQVMLDGVPPGFFNAPDSGPTVDLLTAIDLAIGDVLAVRGTIELADAIVVAKVERLVTLCRELDRMPALSDPHNDPLREALHDVWSAADERRRDISRRRDRLILYVTPIPGMAITDISKAIYGNTGRAMEILQLNRLADPFNIGKGAPIRAYRPALAIAA